jgi:hypothetical protein
MVLFHPMTVVRAAISKYAPYLCAKLDLVRFEVRDCDLDFASDQDRHQTLQPTLAGYGLLKLEEAAAIEHHDSNQEQADLSGQRHGTLARFIRGVDQAIVEALSTAEGRLIYYSISQM